MCCGNASHWWNGGGCGSWGVRCGCGWTGGQHRCGCSWPVPLWSPYDSAAVSADTATLCGGSAAAAGPVWPAVDFPGFASGCGCSG